MAKLASRAAETINKRCLLSDTSESKLQKKSMPKSHKNGNLKRVSRFPGFSFKEIVEESFEVTAIFRISSVESAKTREGNSLPLA